MDNRSLYRLILAKTKILLMVHKYDENTVYLLRQH